MKHKRIVFLTMIILSISQTSALQIRWRELLFIFMALGWILQRRISIEKPEIVDI